MSATTVYDFELLESWSGRHGTGMVHRYDEDTDRTACGREPSLDWSKSSLNYVEREDFCSVCFKPGEIRVVVCKRFR